MKALAMAAAAALMLAAACERQEPAPEAATSREKNTSREQGGEVSGDAAFVAAYVAALNTDDVGKLKALLHPRCRESITEDNEDYFDAVFSRELAQAVPENHKWTFEPLPEGALPLPVLFIFPINPTHQLQIEIGNEAGKTHKIVNYAVNEDGRWFLVIPYPTDEVLGKMRESDVFSQARKAHARSLAAKLKDPLLSELKALLKKDRNAACRRYHEATGESLSMAKEVLALIDRDEEP